MLLILREIPEDAAKYTLVLNEAPENGREVKAAWRINQGVAFIESPQRFHNVDKAIIMATQNSLF